MIPALKECDMLDFNGNNLESNQSWINCKWKNTEQTDSTHDGEIGDI